MRRSLPLFLNTVVNPVLLFPGMVSFGLLRGLASGASSDMALLFDYIDGGLLVAGIVAVFAIFSVMNPVFATVISREGSSLYVMKFLPMRIERQLTAKISIGCILALLPTVLIGTVAVISGLPVGYVIAGALIAVLVIAAVAMTGSIIDLKRSRLNWSDEGKVVMGLNWVAQILAGLVYLGIVALPAMLMLLVDFADTPLQGSTESALACAIYIVVIFAAVDLLLYRWVSRNARRLIMRAG